MAKEYPRPISSTPATSTIRTGRASESSTRAWPLPLARWLRIEVEAGHDHPRDLGRSPRNHRGRVVLQDEAPGQSRVLGTRIVEADDHRHLATEDGFHRGPVERGMRRALVQDQLHAVVGHVHD